MSMSYYDNSTWGPPGRQPSWEQAPPSRSGTSSTVQSVEPTAFSSQFEEIERACDNLIKSGKGFGIGPGRRDSMPMVLGGRPAYPEFDPRAGPQRHHSVSDYESARPHSASNVQGFYANQRFQSRPNDNDSMMQAKRRMAAQRERELRNYHQEQQFNRNVSGAAKSDRSMSPNAMSEDDRRDLIARQHRALYGNESHLYPGPDGSANPRQPGSQDARVASSTGTARGQSPLAYDPFGMQSTNGGVTPTTAGTTDLSQSQPAVQMPPRDKMDGVPKPRSRANSTSPSSNPPTSFSLFDSGAAQQSSRTSTSSPGGTGSPPTTTGAKGSGNGGSGSGAVAPIGTRPAGASASGQAPSNPALSKRSTTPLPSPLSYGFTASDQNISSGVTGPGQGQTSSNPSSAVTDKGPPSSLGWGSGSGVWGTGKGPLGVQASVWG